MSYGNSKKWIAPGVREKQRHEKLNQVRSKICKDSPFWHANFDIDTHKREFNALLQARLQPIDTSPQPPSSTEEQQRESSPASTTTTKTSSSTPSRSPFSGKAAPFTDNLSPVLSLPTIFTPHYKLGNKKFGPRTIAPWPSKSEMKYEGDDRIATDKIHGRFLGAPRVEGNETVNWQHRNVITQYQFENYHQIPDDVAVQMRVVNIGDQELEVDLDGFENSWEWCRHWLGEELWDLLDPVDKL